MPSGRSVRDCIVRLEHPLSQAASPWASRRAMVKPACDGVRRGQENLDGLMCAGMRGRGRLGAALQRRRAPKDSVRRSPATTAISGISDCSWPNAGSESELSSGLMVRRVSVSPCQATLHTDRGNVVVGVRGRKHGDDVAGRGSEKVKTERKKKGQGSGGEGLTVGYSGSCLHLEHWQRITSRRNAQFGRSAPFPGRLRPLGPLLG